MERSICAGGRSSRKPSASSTSAEPEAEETARFPCFATPAPAAAATSAAAVEMLNVRAPSPPVPGRVDQVLAVGPHREDVLAHGFGAARDLVRALALEPERDEEAADLRRRRLAAHDLVHDVARLAPREVAPFEQPRERLLDRHRRPSRKLRPSAGPSGVSTDSGWNWMPITGNSRWRTAITSPSSAVAQTSSSAGTVVAASEW